MNDAMPPPSFAIEERVSDGDGLRLMLSGELDIVSAPALEQRAGELLGGEVRSTVVLDLANLAFIDSTGLRAVVEVGNMCRSQGWEFALAPGPPAVQRLFEVTGLDEVLPFERQPLDSAER